MKIQETETQKKWWQCLLFWLSLIAAVAFLVWPISQLWPQFEYYLTQPLIENVSNKGQGWCGCDDGVELGNSAHFRVVAPMGYMSETELEAFLAKAESRRTQLVEFLGIQGDTRQIIVILDPRDGVPHAIADAIVICAYKAGHNSVIHELTHLLMGYPNSFLGEGLAVMTDERLGWGMSFPNWLRPVNAHIYAHLRANGELPSLTGLMALRDLWDASQPEVSRLRYLQAGSFVKYLSRAHGLETFLATYRHPGFRQTYDRTLGELEHEWLAAIHVGHLNQAILLTLIGLTILSLVNVALFRGRVWIISIVLGMMVFRTWSYYLVYSLTATGALLAAVVMGGLVGYRHRTWGVVILWVGGVISLTAAVLGPSVMAFFGSG